MKCTNIELERGTKHVESYMFLRSQKIFLATGTKHVESYMFLRSQRNIFRERAREDNSIFVSPVVSGTILLVPT